MSGNIDRIEAQQDMRRLSLAVAAQSPEGAMACRQALDKEVGEIVKVAPEAVIAASAVRDEAGFADLKAMADGLK